MPPPAPCKLTFDLLTSKVVSESRVAWAANFSVPTRLFSIYARCTRQTDVRQTDRRHTSGAHHPLMPPPYVGGGIKTEMLREVFLKSSDNEFQAYGAAKTFSISNTYDTSITYTFWFILLTDRHTHTHPPTPHTHTHTQRQKRNLLGDGKKDVQTQAVYMCNKYTHTTQHR